MGRNNIVMNSVTSKLTHRREHRQDGCYGNKYNRSVVTRCSCVVVGRVVATVVIIIITIVIIHSTSLVEVAPIDILLKVGSVGQKTSG